MFRKTIVLGLLASLMTAPAFAESVSKEEGTGVGVGVVIGAIVGGPFGAVVGAAFGAKLGDSIHQRKTDVESLTATLDGSMNRVGVLERDIVSLNGELRQSQEQAQPELLALLQAGIEFDLLFRTDEHVLADNTGSKLRQLAASLVDNPDIQIRLDGYADERGNAAYNQKLSARRAEHVRDLLVSNGIPDARISINARGESPAADTNVDSYALERRVSLVLFMGETQSFAANPR